MQLSLLTLNLAGYKDWQTRERQVITALNQADADIVLLQEVRYDPYISAFTQAMYINTLLDNPYAYSSSGISRYYIPSAGEPFREGLAILSKYPLKNSETLALTKLPEDTHTRIIQYVDIDISDTQVSLTNVHFSNNQFSPLQLEETLTILSERDTTGIVAGDFNIFNIDHQRSLYGDGYHVSTDFLSYVSFPEKNLTLDYILLPKTIRFLSLNTITGVSDHDGVLAVIEL